MKFFCLIFLILVTHQVHAFGNNFPIKPDSQLTPGKLCDRPTSYRYPEHIAYCERDVTYETKEALIHLYDTKLGFNIETMDRADFKIDHFIPLCVGGSNDSVNLWPQHKSVYLITDPVEPLVCQRMLEGKLSQADAIKMITLAKTNLNMVPAIMKQLGRM
jgi:hypothetical protein